MRVALLGSSLLLASCAPVGDVKAPLTSFESGAEQTAQGLVSLYEHAIALKTALDTNDQARLDAFVAQFPADLEQLDQGVTALAAAEEALQAEPSLGTASLQQGLGSGTGFMASLRKMFDFREKYRTWNQSMSDARNERDQATVDLANNVAGADQRLSAAKQKMNEVGHAVIEDLGTSVSTNLVTAPFKPVTLGGKVLKTAGGALYKKGLVVLTSTRACETDVTSKSCVLGVTRTDEQGQVRAPAGDNALVVSGGGYARVRVDQTTFATPPTAIKRALVPISAATASGLTRGDEVDEDGFPVDVAYVPWILCEVRASSTVPPTSGTCVKFDAGDIDTWDAMSSAQQAAWCQGKGFNDGQYSYMDEAGCRHTCALLAASPCTQPCTAFVCTTP